MRLLHPQTREEWLKLRTGYISSTESSALFGKNPRMTAFELAVSKQIASIEETVTGERPKWGLRLQDSIAWGVGIDYGVQVKAMNLTYAVDDDVRMGASFDYEIVHLDESSKLFDGYILREMFEKHGPGILEVKNVDSLEFKNHWSVIDGEIEAPDHIEVQLQHQLALMPHKWGCIAAFVGGNRVALIVRMRDDKVGNLIRMKVGRFWADFEMGKMPDPLMPDDASVIVALYGYADPGKYFDGQDNQQLEEWMSRYKRVSDNISELVKEKEVAKARILEIIKDAEKGESKGFKLSASMRAPTRIEAHDRAGYRDFRITPKKEKK